MSINRFNLNKKTTFLRKKGQSGLSYNLLFKLPDLLAIQTCGRRIEMVALEESLLHHLGTMNVIKMLTSWWHYKKVGQYPLFGG